MQFEANPPVKRCNLASTPKCVLPGPRLFGPSTSRWR